MRFRIQRYLLPVLLVFILSCTNNKQNGTHPDKDTLAPVVSDKISDSLHLKYSHLISNVPIPFDILQKLSNSYVIYKPELLNPITALAGNNQSDSKSLNLGVYGADLTYIISVGEFKEFASHIHAIKRLADELGVSTAFNESTMARYNLNETNRDTLQNVMYHSYHEIDRTLKANDRFGMAALVVCGGWIESLYLTTKTIGNNENSGSYTELYNLVFEQRKHLPNLISLMNDFKIPPFGKITASLEKVRKLYTSSTDDNHLSMEEVKAISEEVAKLRMEITHGS
jgi:hypothetical protein